MIELSKNTEFLVTSIWTIVTLIKMSSDLFQRFHQDFLEKKRSRQESGFCQSGIQKKSVGWRYNLCVIRIQPVIKGTRGNVGREQRGRKRRGPQIKLTNFSTVRGLGSYTIPGPNRAHHKEPRPLSQISC